MRCFRKAPSSKVGLRDTPRLLRSEQHQLLGDDTATTGRDRVGLLVYERGEGGCTVSDTVRVRDLWLFPVGPCRLGNLVYTYCLAVRVWDVLAILLEHLLDYSREPAQPNSKQQAAGQQQPVAADSRPGPATGYHATPHQDLGGGAHACTESLPRHLRTIHGDGA